MGDLQFKAFLKDVYTGWPKTPPGAPIYVFHASREAVNFIEELVGAGFLFKQQLIWVKNNIVLGRQGLPVAARAYFIRMERKGPGPITSLTTGTQRTVMEDKIDFNAMNKRELLNYIKELQNDNDYPSSII